MIVSVVTVCLNARDSIRLTLESVKSQKNVDIRHIVIDGCSSDGTLSIVNEYDPYFVSSEKDSGVYDAMDKASAAIDGDLVIYLNAGDTFYRDSSAAEIVEAFVLTGADIIFGNLLPVYLNAGDMHDHGAFVSGHELDLSYITNRKMLFNESIHHQATVYKKWVPKECTYKCEADNVATGEYNLLLNAVIKKGAKLKYVPIPISRFALGGISTKSFEGEWKKYVAARDALRKIYFSNASSTRLLNHNEFVSFKLSAENKRKNLKILAKSKIRNSILFKIYDRILISVVSRVVNAIRDECSSSIRKEIFMLKHEIIREINRSPCECCDANERYRVIRSKSTLPK